MIRFFRKKKDPEIVKIHSNLTHSFSRMGNDIDYIQNWLRHLHDKNHYLEQKHHSHLELTKKDVENLSNWVHYLNKHTTELRSYFSELITHIKHLQKKDDDLLNRVVQLENNLNSNVSSLKGHLGTLERTTQGQIKDMSLVFKDTLNNHISNIKKDFDDHKTEFQNHQKKFAEIQHSSKQEIEKKVEELPVVEKKVEPNISLVKVKNSLSGSQIELLNVLYDADRPLSYGDLSKILNKKSKSVRNLIYELRDAGIDVKSRFVGLRKKGFYLTNETKILVSGR